MRSLHLAVVLLCILVFAETTATPTESPTTSYGCVFTKPEISCGVDTPGATVQSPSQVYYPTSDDGVFDGESYVVNPYFEAGCIAPSRPSFVLMCMSLTFLPGFVPPLTLTLALTLNPGPNPSL